MFPFSCKFCVQTPDILEEMMKKERVRVRVRCSFKASGEGPHFDYKEGWGKHFQKHGETWRSVVANTASKWHFHASHSDQGLMFYWSKYLIQDVTIVISNIVENWKRGPDGDLVRESELKDLFAPYQEKPLVYQWSCDSSDDKKDKIDAKNSWRCFPPTDGMAHLMGKTKPWKQSRGGVAKAFSTWSYRQRGGSNLWFVVLREINAKYQMGIDLDNWIKFIQN
jgi:hypothetical protein